jgi:hypothetical protein
MKGDLSENNWLHDAAGDCYTINFPPCLAVL